MFFPAALGIIGMLFILFSFILDEFTKINRETRINNLINVLGSSMMVYYAFKIKAWPFLILNLIWAVTSLVKIFILRNNTKSKNKKRIF